MIFDSIPNELLLQILQSLTFEEAIQCALVCKRFHNVIRDNFSKFYIDIWKDGARSPGAVILGRLLITLNSIVAIGEESTDFYEFHPFSRNLYRTARSKMILEHFPYDLIPNTSQIVFCTGPSQNNLIIYDLKKDVPIFETRVDLTVSDIHCGKHTIALCQYSDDEEKIMFFSWDGAEFRFLNERRGSFFFEMSDNGDLAYEFATDWRTVRFDHLSLINKEEEDPETSVGFGDAGRTFESRESDDEAPPRDKIAPYHASADIDAFCLSPCGRYLVTKEIDHYVRIYDIRTETRTQFHLWFSGWWPATAFSSGSRLLLQLSTEGLIVIDLESKKRFFYKEFDVDREIRAGFREIGGHQHVQLISEDKNGKDRRLDLIKFDPSEWIPMDCLENVPLP